MVSDQVVKPLQESLAASIAGDFDKAAELLKTIPTWIGDIVYMGGPGMISGGVVGEATMFLQPAIILLSAMSRPMACNTITIQSLARMAWFCR